MSGDCEQRIRFCLYWKGRVNLDSSSFSVAAWNCNKRRDANWGTWCLLEPPLAFPRYTLHTKVFRDLVVGYNYYCGRIIGWESQWCFSHFLTSRIWRNFTQKTEKLVEFAVEKQKKIHNFRNFFVMGEIFLQKKKHCWLGPLDVRWEVVFGWFTANSCFSLAETPLLTRSWNFVIARLPHVLYLVGRGWNPDSLKLKVHQTITTTMLIQYAGVNCLTTLDCFAMFFPT